MDEKENLHLPKATVGFPSDELPDYDMLDEEQPDEPESPPIEERQEGPPSEEELSVARRRSYAPSSGVIALSPPVHLSLERLMRLKQVGSLLGLYLVLTDLYLGSIVHDAEVIRIIYSNDALSLQAYLALASGQFTPVDITTGPGSGSSGVAYAGGIRNLVYEVVFKNLSTYKFHWRISTWVAKHDVPYIGGDTLFGSIENIFANGYGGYIDQVHQGFPIVNAKSIAGTPFMNPLWTQFFKCVRMTKSRICMPYMSFTVRQKLLVKRPGLITEYGNAGIALNGSRHMGGITLRVKLVEMWGEEVNDAQTWTSTKPHNAPIVFSTNESYRTEMAIGNLVAHTWGVDETTQPTPTSLVQGDPSNLNQAGFQGLSSVTGALSSGI